ncbi:hypothetical protein SAY87_030065 [Trapa incisa]|uniref:Alpha-carbonic anhydrase domain-containing protein n=1 Tax=Trapa incisa TaxID=236973 RepID=A0AAN7Q9S2_9MYRT|nr:hypothetical protein SAY87_030065 [Trapa incisa]
MEYKDNDEDEHPFTYDKVSEVGPMNWGLLKPEWRACKNGKIQSPIDLTSGGVQVSFHLGKLKRDYKPAPATILNRGHDIAVLWKGYAGKIIINGTRYDLVQCHWHSPSEHIFNGTRPDFLLWYNLELHIVHSSPQGKIAVIGIVYKYGRPDRFLKKLISHMHWHGLQEKGKDVLTSDEEPEEKYIGIVNPGEIKFGSRKYYRYIGSLTTPPCTEGVVWTISKKVRTVSRQQVRALRAAVHDSFKVNARPVQKLDGRKVSMYRPRVLRDLLG